MTVIVGLIDKGKVYMGGDSCLFHNGGSYEIIDHSKVYRFRDMLIGITGPVRVCQVIQYMLDLPEPVEGVTEMAYMVKEVATAVQKCVKAAGMMQESQGTETMGSNVLIGWRGNLYRIGAGFSIATFSRPYEAVGSGEQYALGALHALDGECTNPFFAVRRALEAATAFTGSVRPPFTVDIL